MRPTEEELVVMRGVSELVKGAARLAMIQYLPASIRTVKDVARMLKVHLENLLTYFTPAISNAMTEAFNSKIQSLKYAALGFRALANLRIRILFFCGRLDLYLSIH